jgi:hypothetical protein
LGSVSEAGRAAVEAKSFPVSVTKSIAEEEKSKGREATGSSGIRVRPEWFERPSS